MLLIAQMLLADIANRELGKLASFLFHEGKY